MRMGKRLLRSLALSFGCIAIASLVCHIFITFVLMKTTFFYSKFKKIILFLFQGYTGIVNLIEFISGYVPIALYNNQV